MEQKLYKLPETWEWKTIGESCEKVTDGSHNPPKRKNSGRPMLSSRNIHDGHIVWDQYRLIADAEFKKEHRRTRISNGDILLTIVGTIGRTVVVRDYPELFTLQRSVAVLASALELPEFISYQLRSPLLQDFFSKEAKGAAQKGIYLKQIKSIYLAFPPIDEQKRIVAKLNVLFTRIDTAIKHLQDNLKLSKNLFARVLDTTFIPSGNIENLPTAWSCESLQAVSNLITDGTHHSPKEQFDSEQDGLFKYITSKNVKFDGLKLDKITYIRKELHNPIYARCNPEYLDQLITKDGAMTGTCCLNTLDEPFSLLSSVALVKLKRDIMSPYFLNFFLQSPTGQELMLGDISGAAITRTNLKKLKALKVPLPPMKEQQSIINHLDSLAKRTRAIEAATEEKLRDLAALKSSLLDNAFRGQL